MKFVWPDQLPLVEQDPQPAPEEVKKKNKKVKKGGHNKATNVGLEVFVDWTDPTASGPVEEMEDNLSILAAGFAVRMHKRATSSQGETILGYEEPDGKHPKGFGLDEEAQNNSTVITVDSLEQASNALQALEGAAQEAPREACASLEDEIPNGGSPNANRAMGEAPLEIAVELSFWVRFVNVVPHRLRGPGRLVLNSPVILMKWEHPSMGAPILSPDTAQSIIDLRSPFNQRDTSVTNLCDLYPTSHCIPVVVLLKEYFIPFPNYLDNKSY